MNKDIEQLLAPLTDQLQSTIGNWVQGQEKQYMSRLENLSAALTKASEELKNRDEDELASLLNSTTEGINSITSRMENVDGKELISVIREQSHEHPAGVFMASMVAGFASSRVAKEAVSQASAEATASSDSFKTGSLSASGSDREINGLNGRSTSEGSGLATEDIGDDGGLMADEGGSLDRIDPKSSLGGDNFNSNQSKISKSDSNSFNQGRGESSSRDSDSPSRI